MIILLTIGLSLDIFLVFISCEFAERLGMRFDEINDEINNFNWYLFPHGILQKALPTIMINAQKKVYFECFGSITCNRENFKKV